jgi:2-succinyl-6-hydroxy-2,4-cyclohexadiene-1-carboxylate synthase
VLGSGERLVLVHGFTQTGRSMRPLQELLAPYFEVVTVDLPFHGPKATPVADLEEAAALLASSCGAASYLGYSLGGRVCLTLALERPEVVERLVLVGATAGIAEETERADRRAEDEALAARLEGEGADRLGLEEFLDLWLAGPLFSHLSPEQADRRSRRENSTSGLAAALRHLGTGTQRPSHERLASLTMPVLLLAGRDDSKFAAISAELAGLIGENASYELIEGSGHAVPFERPAALAAVVRAFLDANP